ncbi:hypothetical protein ACXHVK_000179 [Morganella morganii]|uniref:hypothetical protein n=1 Tax=Morganella morganii TaxID=582 RepID=UPI000B0EC466|nr:hypothetical protein [Morganella morganii]EKK5375368.1 hypothetical protein [Morganella morganii]MDF2406253.1 hypothetical protein [Morganella morganii]HCR4033004.1 hypothetical protein [Morganella morganii]
MFITLLGVLNRHFAGRIKLKGEIDLFLTGDKKTEARQRYFVPGFCAVFSD